MHKGFIYLTFSMLIKVLTTLNPVEWVKNCFLLLFCSPNSTAVKVTTIRRLAIDTFIFLKFVFLAIAIQRPSNLIAYIVGYLCFSNIFTYFNYHVWDVKSGLDIDSRRRRFINLLLSLFYNILSFSFFYKLILIPLKINGDIGNFILSLMNTFMLGSDVLQSGVFENSTYQMIFVIQGLMSFGFLTIILSNTVIGENDGLQK